MLSLKAPGGSVSCLLIDDLWSGESALSGLSCFSGLAGRPFVPGEGIELHEALQIALQECRADGGAAAIAARGLGCEAALAAAEQLPVDRLALLRPMARSDIRKRIRFLPPKQERDVAARRRQLARLSAYARRNLSLCVSDVLIVEDTAARAGRALLEAGLGANGRVTLLKIPGGIDKSLYINREFELKNAISSFLRSGELPKSLAENHEMCIIYG